MRQFSSVLNYSLEVSGTTENFAVVGSYSALPGFQLIASGGRSFYEYGSLGVSVVYQSFHEALARTIVSANHTKTFRNFLSLSTYVSFVNVERGDFTAGIRFSMPFGENYSTNGGIGSGRSVTTVDAEVRRNLPVGTDRVLPSQRWSYSLSVSRAASLLLTSRDCQITRTPRGEQWLMVIWSNSSRP